jgi:hypothetical protein
MNKFIYAFGAVICAVVATVIFCGATPEFLNMNNEAEFAFFNAFFAPCLAVMAVKCD